MNSDYTIDELKNLQNHAVEFIVYAPDRIRGFSYSTLSITDAGEQEAQLSVYVEPSSRLQGIGTALYNEMESRLQKHQPHYLCHYMNVNHIDRGPFAKKMGLHKWWGSAEFIYKGDGFPPIELPFTKYRDKDFKAFLELNQQGYYPLQKSNDLKPYIATEDIIKTYKLHDKDNVYVLYENNRLVATVSTGDGEIENLVVSPDEQGKGYGRKALQFGMNKLVQQGHNEIRLCFMENNHQAENLYKSLGYKPLHLTHIYRKFLIN